MDVAIRESISHFLRPTSGQRHFRARSEVLGPAATSRQDPGLPVGALAARFVAPLLGAEG